jgi:hypothetical protein
MTPKLCTSMRCVGFLARLCSGFRNNKKNSVSEIYLPLVIFGTDIQTNAKE